MPDSGETAPSPSTQLLERWRRLNFQISKTLEAPSVEAVHQLRVATRRLNQALAAFEEWVPATQAASLRRRLRTLRSAAAGVRDCDIAVNWLDKSNEASAVRDELNARRKRAERSLMPALRQWRRSMPKLAPLPMPRDARNRATLLDRASTFFRKGARASEEESPRKLHKLRIAAKKLRYTLELFQPAYGPVATSRLEQLNQVQSTLGSINDLRSTRKLLKELGGGRKLDAALRKEQRKKVERFTDLWESVFPARARKEWIAFLELPPRKPVKSERAESSAASGTEG